VVAREAARLARGGQFTKTLVTKTLITMALVLD
jgi:hypothetical protein